MGWRRLAERRDRRRAVELRGDRHGALDDTRGLWVFAALFGTFALVGVAASFLTGE